MAQNSAPIAVPAEHSAPVTPSSQPARTSTARRVGVLAAKLAATAALASGIAALGASASIVVVSVLGLIAVHEAAHYGAARIFGMDVLSYSIGLGPELVGWTNRKGVRLSLRCLPLGGFVKISGQSLSDDIGDRDEAATFRSAKPSARIAVAAAGPLSNVAIALGGFILAVVIAGAPVTRIVGEVDGTPSEVVAVGDTTGIEAMSAALHGGGAHTLTLVDGRQVRWGDGTDEVAGLAAVSTREKVSLPAAASVGTGRVVELAGPVTNSIIRFPLIAVSSVGGVAAGEEVAESDRIVSPVGLVRLADYAAGEGLATSIELVALISLFVAVFNLVPLPPLDGGHIVQTGVEAGLSRIRGRQVRIPARAINALGLSVAGLVLVVGVAAAVIDVTDPMVNPFGAAVGVAAQLAR